MKKILASFYYLGLIFWSGVLLQSVFMFIGYNGLFDLFIYETADDIEIDVQKDSSLVHVSYVYFVNGEQFENEFETSINYFDSFGIDSVLVEYNKELPFLSVVKGLPNMQRREKIIMTISTIFLGLQTLFYKLAVRKRNKKILN